MKTLELAGYAVLGWELTIAVAVAIWRVLP